MASDKKIKSRKIRKDLGIEKAEIKDIETAKKNKKTAEKDSIVVKNKKIKTRKLKMAIFSVEEKKLDKEIEKEDNLSVMVMVIILALCFVVGISLGYLLYRIAINGAI